MQLRFFLLTILMTGTGWAWSQMAPDGFSASPFQPVRNVQLTAFVQQESYKALQKVWWSAKNLGSDNLAISFTKVVHTTCGTTLREKAETILKPGAIVTGSTFAGEMSFESQVWDDDCPEKNRIKSVAYENLVIKTVAGADTKAPENKTPETTRSSPKNTSPAAPGKGTASTQSNPNSSATALERSTRKDSAILSHASAKSFPTLPEIGTDSAFAIVYERDYEAGERSPISLNTYVVYRNPDGFFPFMEDLRVNRDSWADQTGVYEFIGFIAQPTTFKNTLAQIEIQAKKQGLPVKKEAKITKLNTHTRKKLTEEDFWKVISL